MTIVREDELEDPFVTALESVSAEPVSRRSLLGKISLWSFPRRMTAASAALFAGIAARATEPALAHPGQGNYGCCDLAREDQWCSEVVGGDFWCDHGGFKRVWYCCNFGYLVGCGECQSGTGTCFDGPTWYCSYGWWTGSYCS